MAETTNPFSGLGTILGQAGDFAKGTLTTYKDIYSIFKSKPATVPATPAATTTTAAAPLTNSGTAWLTGGGIGLVIVIVLAIVLLRR